MTIDELVERYHCSDTHGESCDCDCEDCKKCIKEDLEEHDEKLKAEIIETMADIVRKFAKTWNMEQSSRIPYIARDELISELRMAIKKVK